MVGWRMPSSLTRDSRERESISFLYLWCLFEYFIRGVLKGAFVWWAYHTPGYFHCLTEAMSTPSLGKESLPSIKGWLYPFLSENEDDITGNIFPLLWLPGSSIKFDTRHDDQEDPYVCAHFLFPLPLSSLFLRSLFPIQSLVCVCHHFTEEFTIPGSIRHIAVNYQSGSG